MSEEKGRPCWVTISITTPVTMEELNAIMSFAIEAEPTTYARATGYPAVIEMKIEASKFIQAIRDRAMETCRNGHLRTRGNTRVDPTGHKRCTQCERDRKGTK